MKSKKRRAKGMLPKKRRMYQNGGGVGDPPQGTITPQEALMRALQPDNQFRLTGGDAPFRTIKQEQDRMTAETVDDSMFEMARFVPGIDVLIDSAELAKVAATGEDFYGEEQDPAMFAGMTAAGYLIPNILEKPLKSAWRAVKKFPAKLPKREFRELPTENREAVLQNLTQAHEEAYPEAVDFTMGDANPNPMNVRQLPSLMSGSKLENAVGKDGMVQVSQIENLINSKDISAAEREALRDALFKSRVQQGEALGLESGAPLPDKIDYLNFKRAGMGNMNRPFSVEESNQYADYGLGNLGYSFDAIPSLEKQGLEARTNLIRTRDPELQSTEYGHFGEDVIGHYRTFERPDERGVLYISELQADPLQARGPKGQKTVALDVSKPVDVDAQLETARIQLEAAEKHLAEVRAGAPYNPQKVYGAEGLPTGRGSLDDPRGISAINKSEALGADDITVLRETDLEALTPMARAKREADFMAPTEQLISFMDEHKRYIQALEGGYRGGPNPKQASLIKNQDQFLISHILEREAKGADKLRFPTGETTSKIQGYGDIQRNVQRAERDLDTEQRALDGLMAERDMFGNSVPTRLANRVEGMGLKNRDYGETLDYLGRVRASRTRARASRDLDSDPVIQYNKIAVEKFDNDALKLAYKEFKDQAAADGQKLNVDAPGFKQAVQARATSIKTNIHTYSTYIERIKSQKEHLARVNASTQATQGIMKGYDRLPKALKKHGLDATKVTDDVGNSWWEVDIPARLGEGVGEIRAYKSGGKFRILKK